VSRKRLAFARCVMSTVLPPGIRHALRRRR